VCLAWFIAATHAPAWAVSPKLPKDVATFMERREACDHWRGEEGFDAARRAEIQRGMCQSCIGTDAQLAHLKHKYRAAPDVLMQLAGLEPQIETQDAGESKRICSTVQKPSR
jgi:hypothetical protein